MFFSSKVFHPALEIFGIHGVPHDLGEGRSDMRGPVANLTGQSRSKTFDRITQDQEKFCIGCGFSKERRHPGVVEVVGGPFPSEGADPTWELPVVVRDV